MRPIGLTSSMPPVAVRRVLGIALALGLSSTPAAAQVATWPREAPPPPLEERAVHFPPYEVRTLENGLQVVAVPHHEQPAVSVRLLLRSGASQDPPDKAGVASLVARLLDQGTTSRSAQEIAGTIDSVGGALSTGAGNDLTFVNVIVMKDSFDFALDLVADMVRRPVFAEEEIERQRQQFATSFKVSYDDPAYVAGVVFDRLAFGFHPYGLPVSGTPDSIGRLTRDDLVAYHEANFVSNNCIVAVVGDIGVEEAFTGVERVFGDWPGREVTLAAEAEPPPPTRRLIVIDRPDAVQSEIRVGHLAIPRKHPDYLALNLAVKILGGEGGNRLHRVLRSARGLTYGAAADMETLKRAGSIVAETATRSEATAEALRLMVEEFWKLQKGLVGPRELADAQAYLAGNFPLTIEIPAAIALQVLNALFYGLELEDLEAYPERLKAVTPEDIRRVARTHLKPDRLSVVVVGDASSFVGQLEGAGFPDYERVPLADLDLTSATFRRGSTSARRVGEALEDPGGADVWRADAAPTVRPTGESVGDPQPLDPEVSHAGAARGEP